MLAAAGYSMSHEERLGTALLPYEQMSVRTKRVPKLATIFGTSCYPPAMNEKRLFVQGYLRDVLEAELTRELIER